MRNKNNPFRNFADVKPTCEKTAYALKYPNGSFAALAYWSNGDQAFQVSLGCVPDGDPEGWRPII